MQAGKPRLIARSHSVPVESYTSPSDTLPSKAKPIPILVHNPYIPQVYDLSDFFSRAHLTREAARHQVEPVRPTKFIQPLLPPENQLKPLFARSLSPLPHSSTEYKPINKSASLSAGCTPIPLDTHTTSSSKKLSVKTPLLPEPYTPSTDYRANPEQLVADIRNLNPYDKKSRDKLVQSIKSTSSLYASDIGISSDYHKSGQGVLLDIFDNPQFNLWKIQLPHLINLFIAMKKEPSSSKPALIPLNSLLCHTLLTARVKLGRMTYEVLSTLRDSQNPQEAYKANKIAYQLVYLGADDTPESSLRILAQNPDWIDEIAPETRKSLISSMESFVRDNPKPKQRKNRAIKELYESFLADPDRNVDDVEAIKVKKKAESYHANPEREALKRTISLPSHPPIDRSGLNQPS